MMPSKIITSVVVIGFSSVLMVGCVNKTTSSSSAQSASVTASACSGNLYLEKYNCSLESVQQAALSGNPDAQYALGYMYYNGIGTIKDEQTGMLWIQRAASQGEPLAQQAQHLLKSGEASIAAQNATVSHPQSVVSSASVVASSSAPDPRLTSSYPSQNASLKTASINSSLNSNIMIKRPNNYTVQLMGSYDRRAIQRFVDQASLGNNAVIYEASFHGKPWFTLIYGDYQSAKAAKEAIAVMSSNLRELHPWVKSFKSIQDEIKQNAVG
ncbi:MAG: hypothetical protein CL816_03760 [Coxiellaceae bacterium]|nr:hypothetical protein [Coxiellaceae bacterium]